MPQDEPSVGGGSPDDEQAQARRDFLKKAGLYAATVPPAMALMLGVTAKKAEAKYGGRWGRGQGGDNRGQTGKPF